MPSLKALMHRKPTTKITSHPAMTGSSLGSITTRALPAPRKTSARSCSDSLMTARPVRWTLLSQNPSAASAGTQQTVWNWSGSSKPCTFRFISRRKISTPAQWRASCFWQFSPAWPKASLFPYQKTASGQSRNALRAAPIKSATHPTATIGMASRW